MITKKITTYLLILSCASLLLNSCQTDESRPISRFDHETHLGFQNLSPAIDPSELSPDEQKIFATLSPGEQLLFGSLSPEQRSWAMNLTHPETPEQAVWKAAEQEVLKLSIPSQNLYHELRQKDKWIFLVLDDGPTKAAIDYAKSMSPSNAVAEALKLEINSYPEKFQRIINKLTIHEQILFLTLSDSTQIQIFTLLENNTISEALDKAKELDIQRLPKDEQMFIKKLSSDNQTLFLMLPPEGRWMAISLTKKLDFNLAMEYAASIQTGDNPN